LLVLGRNHLLSRNHLDSGGMSASQLRYGGCFKLCWVPRSA
jgi:hypothetical protein